MEINYTEEQKAFIDSVGNTIAEACAGSGKSSSLKGYAKKRPKEKMLYLCFNKSVKDEAKTSFPQNVEVQNAHSLAYRATQAYSYELSKGISNFDVMQALGIKKGDHSDKYFPIKLASHILNKFNIFCCVEEMNIGKMNYLEYSDTCFAGSNIKEIDEGAKKLWDMMIGKKMPITHNFYLKLFQISEPKLGYDVILYDECLTYDTEIHLADGGFAKIGDIVENKREATVLSYNEETRTQEECRIVAWQKIPSTKRMYSIFTGSSYFAGPVTCTEDHKIYVLNKGWVEAKDIVRGDIVQFVNDAGSGYSYGSVSALVEVNLKNYGDYVYDITVEKCHNFYANGILVHNCQDANPCMLDIFLKQKKTTKIAVGDSNQSIYGFNRAVDALQKLKGFNKYTLSWSFRFPQDIADTANQILDLKKQYISIDSGLQVIGKGNSKTLETRAVIARSNIHLLEKALMLVDSGVNLIHFEGGFGNYVFAGDSSLYDIYNLWQGDKSRIRSKFISHFETYSELKEYLEEVPMRDLEIMCSIVERYKRSLMMILKRVKDCDVPKAQADVVLTTVHKAKGLEYDIVELGSDFISERSINELDLSEQFNIDKVREEINILYVALTRAKNKVIFPNNILFGQSKLKDSLGYNIVNYPKLKLRGLRGNS